VFWLLSKQAIQVLTAALGARGARYRSSYLLVKFLSEALAVRKVRTRQNGLCAVRNTNKVAALGPYLASFFEQYMLETVLVFCEGVFSSVVLKVGGIAPKGAILRGKGAKKTKGATGGQNTTKGGENAQALIDHWVNFRCLLLWLVGFLQILIYYDNCWRLLLKEFICWILLWILYVSVYSVDYFHKILIVTLAS